jgi:hypothetical protein
LICVKGFSEFNTKSKVFTSVRSRAGQLRPVSTDNCSRGAGETND